MRWLDTALSLIGFYPLQISSPASRLIVAVDVASSRDEPKRCRVTALRVRLAWDIHLGVKVPYRLG
ncbi:MAG: hypothetical protein JW941_08335, partial [Candidatus Coatesbacteria bacterium]|nr:hypothetical protein [Candidatus Coatesbacteria bacterium]